ncbi:hypothetical protein EYC80_003111 [Monilinia laxa]|uniref:Uncharacterized protein n=1 Tax=Monilinia laxa TaxID=61186 RepID=A0A5N6KCX8_MONLA|nr:hypothetical protein EYC80_003111 [Monilinia laxa]
MYIRIEIQEMINCIGMYLGNGIFFFTSTTPCACANACATATATATVSPLRTSPHQRKQSEKDENLKKPSTHGLKEPSPPHFLSYIHSSYCNCIDVNNMRQSDNVRTQISRISHHRTPQAKTSQRNIRNHHPHLPIHPILFLPCRKTPYNQSA